MAYLTYDGLVIRYPDAKSWARTEADVSSSFIAQAEAEINAKLAVAYNVPISGTYPILESLTADQAAALVMYRNDPDRAEKLQAWIDKRIGALVAGDAALVAADGSTVAADAGDSAPIWSSTMDYQPTASILPADSPYTHVDSSYSYDEETARI